MFLSVHRPNQKARHFSKSKKIYITFLFTKIQTLYVPWFFMKILKLAFIYKKHDTLQYVTFLYTKIHTLRKKQDNLRYVFIYKNLHTLRYAIFHWIFEIGGRGGAFLYAKTINFALHSYILKKLPCVTFLHAKFLTLRVTFLSAKNNALCVTFLYLKFIVYYSYLTITARTIRLIGSKNKFKLFIENWSYSYDK